MLLTFFAARLINSKKIAFVRYKLRTCAEFAKVAMANQPLGSRATVNCDVHLTARHLTITVRALFSF